LGVDWEPAWLEIESEDQDEGDAGMPHGETTAGFAGVTFRYTTDEWLTAVDVTDTPAGNMVYDTVASTT
jgi:hypothetical protein